jgi:NAD(P)-dependent dehydrogenase (short-subunit alcohol dehydrogenase family)
VLGAPADTSLSGKRTIVTGSGGRSVTLLCVVRGASVLGAALSRVGAVEPASDAGDARLWAEVDVADEASVATLFDSGRHLLDGPGEILVNVAGMGSSRGQRRCPHSSGML